MSEVQRSEDGKHGSFFIEKDGAHVADMTYSRGPDGKLIIIDHTEVDPALRGQGIPRRLVAAAVEWARAEKIRIVPLCPYAKAVFDKTPDLQDVLR
ncbi:MAG: GNAT family N-acetyltransferase [Myxococcales bacterium]